MLCQGGGSDDERRFNDYEQFLISLAKLESITWLSADTQAPSSSVQLVGDMKVLVPMAGLIDKDAEIARLSKELSKLENEIKRAEGKLSNPKFTEKAPAEVVAKEEAKLNEAKNAADRLKAQRQEIENL